MDTHVELTGDSILETDRYLRFLKAEGLDLLASFRRISDPTKRKLVADLAEMLADPVPPAKLDGSY